MESLHPENHDSLFFHLQKNPVRYYRRVRKEPEELPQALRYFKYANLNPRIAAFLGKQDPKNVIKRGKTGGKEGKDAGPGAPSGGLIPGDYGAELSHEARGLLPEIGQGYKMFGDDQFGQSRLSFNEPEDSQRYQFEETTFAAPNILRELTDILTKFDEAFTAYSNSRTLYDPSSGEPLPHENMSPSVMLPAGITNLLCQEWEEITAETIYAPRVWQSTAYQAGYKYAATLASGKRESPKPEVPTIVPPKSAPATKNELKSIVDLLDDSRNKTSNKRDADVSGAKKTKNSSKDAALLSLTTLGSVKGSLGSNQVDSAGNRGSIARKSSLKSLDNVDKGKRRISSVKLVDVADKLRNKKSNPRLDITRSRQNVKASKTNLIKLQRGNVGLAGKKDWSRGSQMSVMDIADKPRHGNPTLSFNLSSKKAFDEGWIVKGQPDPDLEKNNLMEWATGRLQAAIKQKEEDAKSRGCNKQVLIRSYGDSRRDTLLKLYRKGNSENDSKFARVVAGMLPLRKSGSKTGKIPQLNKLDGGEKEKFLVQLPDGSVTIYYAKSGKVAVLASAVPGKPGQLYIQCYDNNDERTCLGCFTPYGKSCCYHKNGTPGLVLLEKGCLVKTEEGNVARKFEWDENGSNLKENVTFQLNKEMFVRVNSKNNVILTFLSNRETFKLNVGAVPGAVVGTPAQEKMGILQSGYKMESRAASEYQSAPPRPAKEEKTKSSKLRKLLPKKHAPVRKAEIEELRRSLDPADNFEFESQADRELRRIQDKARCVVEDWMEHYRVALGVASPALKKMLDKPQARPSTRLIQSAKDRRPYSDDGDVIKDFQSFRSPSAPPRHMVAGPNSIMVADDSFRRTGSHMTKQEVKRTSETHVRIVDSPLEVSKPRSPMKSDGSHQQGSLASSKQRPSTLGSRPLNRPQRSSTSAGAVGCGRNWVPAPECCPVSTRQEILQIASNIPKTHYKAFVCKCSKHRIPQIHDAELDYFIRKVAPTNQILVVCVVNSLYPDSSPFDSMFDKLYVNKNKNRSKPCLQSKHDQYRVLRYDLAVAKIGTNRPMPLLLGRHNVVPGMTLMYCNGRLLFADHIFNGYGNAKNDFQKQVFKSRQDFLLGHFLPDDFRFTPGRGKSGLRAAWGGEMRGAGVDGKGNPGMYFSSSNLVDKSANKTEALNRFASPVMDTTKSCSDVTSETRTDVVTMPHSKSFDTARDFVQYSLSTRVYVVPSNTSKPVAHAPTNHQSLINSSFPPAGATEHSTVTPSGGLAMGNLARMQAVK